MSTPLASPRAAIRMADLLHAELIKIRTLPATWLALCAAFAAHTVLGLLAGTDAVRIGGPGGLHEIGRLGTLMLSPVYAFVAVAVFAGGGEYRGGQLRVTLAAMPRRTRLFAAKLAATVVAALLAAVPVVLPGHLLQHAPGFGGDRLAALLAVHLLLSLIGYGLAVAARGVVAPLAALALAAVVVAPALRGALPGLVSLLPHDAALSLLGRPADPATALTRPAALLTLTTWAAASVGTAWALFVHRDS
jgi:hypothetical protein